MNAKISTIACALLLTTGCFAGKKQKPAACACHTCEVRSEKYAKVDDSFIELCSSVQANLREHLAVLADDSEFLTSAHAVRSDIGIQVLVAMHAVVAPMIASFESIRVSACGMRGNLDDSELFRILYRDVERHLAECLRVIVPQAIAMGDALMSLHPDKLSDHFCDDLSRRCLASKNAYARLTSRHDMDALEQDLNDALIICRVCRMIHVNNKVK